MTNFTQFKDLTAIEEILNGTKKYVDKKLVPFFYKLSAVSRYMGT